MKRIDRLFTSLESAALACLGVVLLWLAMSGRFASFVPPSARLGIIAASLGLLACSLALSASIGTASSHEDPLAVDSLGHTPVAAAAGAVAQAPVGWSDPTFARGLTRALTVVTTALLVILPFHVSPSDLASAALSARGDARGSDVNSEDSSGDTPDGSPRSEESGPLRDEENPSVNGAAASPDSPLELTTETFYSQVEELIANGLAHDGQRIELTGFVMSEASARGQASIPRLTQQESFAVARMAIWCCAADAYPIGFAVRWQEEPPAADTWVHVSGTLRVRGSKALIIDADSVTQVPAPDPEFVVQKR